MPEGLERKVGLRRSVDRSERRALPGIEAPDRRVTGIVLAGGKSSRLGQDKALLRLTGGVTLVEATVERLRPLVDEVLVVASDGGRLGQLPARVVADVFPDGGALGGIYSGLAAARHEYALVVACDMPFLNPDLLRYLLELPRDYDALLPRLAGGLLEPLHAAYARACCEPIRARLAAGRYRVVGFLDAVRVRYVEEPELRLLDPELRSFYNVNTPEELEKALRACEH